MSLLGKIGAALIVLIVGSLTMCAFNKRTVYADPNVTPAFERDKADAQPVLAALSQYYAAHAFYPRSVGDLGLGEGDLRGFHYELWSMDRVYHSLDCAGRAKDFEGFVATIPNFEQKLAAFRDECVRGYSNFLLKSARIPTAWPVNQNLVVFAQFSSRDARWSVEWCSHAAHQNPALRDCSQFSLDESVPPGPSRIVRSGARSRNAVPEVK